MPETRELRQLAARLRAGRQVSDDEFDRVYPADIAALSRLHFTPVEVAVRAAQLLALGPDARVLDLGAGAGKLCLIGALVTGAEFTGVEQRGHFVEAAVQAGADLAVDSARFIRGDILAVDWTAYDAYYLFNPFAEHLIGAIDPSVAVEPALYRFYVEEVHARLRRAPPGTRVVTYHGFGTDPPPGFRLDWKELSGTDALELWIRVWPAERDRPRAA